jgi:hypothetical protein
LPIVATNFFGTIRVIRRCISRKSARSARFALGCTIALAVEADDDLLWVWIGALAEYDQLVQRQP